MPRQPVWTAEDRAVALAVLDEVSLKAVYGDDGVDDPTVPHRLRGEGPAIHVVQAPRAVWLRCACGMLRHRSALAVYWAEQAAEGKPVGSGFAPHGSCEGAPGLKAVRPVLVVNHRTGELLAALNPGDGFTVDAVERWAQLEHLRP